MKKERLFYLLILFIFLVIGIVIVEFKANALAIRYTSAVLIPAVNNSRELPSTGETNERSFLNLTGKK